MKTLFLLLGSLLLCSQGYSQPSDLLILKKKGETLQTFFPGNEIVFYTATGNYDSYIRSIHNDSLFLVQYDVRQIQTSLGVYILDTLAKYPFAVNYQDIKGFGKAGNPNFDWSASGGVLLGGGALLAVVGMGTWLFTKPNTQYYASPYLVGGAALLAGIGYLLAKSHGPQKILGKKYSLQYVRVN